MRRVTLIAAWLAGTVVLTAAPAGAATQEPTWRKIGSPLQISEQSALSCITSSWCMSVGAGSTMIWDGKAWAKAPGSFDFRVADVSCSSRWDCMAVGSDDVEVSGGGQSISVPVAMHWNGAHWTTVPVPSPSPADDALTAVSCPTWNTCWVAGTLPDHVLLWQNDSWSQHGIPLADAGHVFVRDIDCATVTSCYLVGSARFDVGEIGTAFGIWDGYVWRTEFVPGNPDLTAISCPSATSCMTVGKEGGRLIGTAWNGTTWQEATVPDSPDRFDNAEQNPDGSELLTSVSCWAANGCQAVGVTNTAPFHRVWNGASWSVLANPLVADTIAATDEVRYDVNSIDCVDASFCLTAGGTLAATLVSVAYMERYAPS